MKIRYKKIKQTIETLETLTGKELKEAINISKKRYVTLDKKKIGETTIRMIKQLSKNYNYSVQENGCNEIAIIIEPTI